MDYHRLKGEKVVSGNVDIRPFTDWLNRVFIRRIGRVALREWEDYFMKIDHNNSAYRIRVRPMLCELLRQPNILLFDEAVFNLDPQTAEQFAHTINKLKGKVTIIFITHQLPNSLQIDEVVRLGSAVQHTNLKQ